MWKKLKSTVIFRHPRITLHEDRVQLPSGEVVEYLRHGSNKQSVTLVCIKNNKILIQKEYSYPVDQVLYQFPGGKVEEGETLFQAAQRELLEESSLKATSLTELGWFFVDNRRSNAKMHVYLATNVSSAKPVSGDLEENITSLWVDLSEIDTMISSGKILNYSLLAAWALFKAKRE